MGTSGLSGAEAAVTRVLVVLHYGLFGGPHNRFANIYAPLTEAGVSLTVLLPDEDGDAVDRFERASVPTLTLPLGRLRARLDPRLQLALLRDLRRDVRQLKGAIHKTRADAVLLAGLANPHAAIAGDQLGVPVVWQIVDSRVPSPARQVLMRSVRKRCDCAMFWGERIRSMHGGERLPMPNMLSNSPVDHARFRFSPQARRESRAAWSIPDEAPVVGSIANINPQKGIEYLIRAAPLILNQVPNAHFVIVGSKYSTHPEYAERLGREVEDLQIPAGRFHFLAPRPDVENALAAFDVKVISSVPASEGIPTTALEAMSVGVPVVTTDVGSVAEAVTDGETGFVVPPLSPPSIATRVVELLRDPHLRQRLGSSGRERAIARFGIQRCVDDHLKAFALARSYRDARTR